MIPFFVQYCSNSIWFTVIGLINNYKTLLTLGSEMKKVKKTDMALNTEKVKMLTFFYINIDFENLQFFVF